MYNRFCRGTSGAVSACRLLSLVWKEIRPPLNGHGILNVECQHVPIPSVDASFNVASLDVEVCYPQSYGRAKLHSLLVFQITSYLLRFLFQVGRAGSMVGGAGRRVGGVVGGVVGLVWGGRAAPAESHDHDALGTDRNGTVADPR